MELAAPLEITLLPAISHVVSVRSLGQPVPGALVAAEGPSLRTTGVTGQDGMVRLRLPAKAGIRNVVAWHPTLGVSGKANENDQPLEPSTQLSLLAPAPHKIRVIDSHGKPVAGLDLGVSVRTEDSDWMAVASFQATHVRTDENGTAIVPWLPREKLLYIDADLRGSGWKFDERDLTKINSGVSTFHVRREQSVTGRILMPNGASAEGVLVIGYGFGPARSGHIPYARAARDGTFTLGVASGHGYVLGITDLQWAADPWSGVILTQDTDTPAKIEINAYPATPFSVRVTRGPRHDPVANASIHLTSIRSVNYIDGRGKTQTGLSGPGTWLTTDAHGMATAAVGKGEQRLRLSSAAWREEQSVNVTGEKPVAVEFHRPWSADQRITGRLIHQGAPYAPSPTAAAQAWALQDPYLPLIFQPRIHPDGTFEVLFDAKSVSLSIIDRDRELCAFAEQIPGDSHRELTMVPISATYSGTLLNEKSQPIAERTLRLYIKDAYNLDCVLSQRTDSLGRFRFVGVPANVPLVLDLKDENHKPDYYIVNRDRIFRDGEFKENDEVRPRHFTQQSD